MTTRCSCSKTDKSNCCLHETLFPEATCGFRRRDVGNCALKFRSRKNTSLRLQPDWFLLAFILLFMHQDSLDKISILFIRQNSLNQFRPCVTFFWTNFQLCPFITILLTTFVHASRCSERVLDDRRNRRLDEASSRLVIINDRDPKTRVRAAQQWFRPEILDLCIARILQS